MSTDETSLISRALAWIEDDPDPETRLELANLVERVEKSDSEALEQLRERFSGHLTFGTAGLRAELGAGPMRMNRVVVGHAAHGLARYLQQHSGPKGLRVIIGYDARKNSEVFAHDTAEIMAGAGISALVMPAAYPTPVLAFAVRDLGADAGVMVTASHNPPGDNGYKVYLGGADEGSQIIPPADQEIHRAILESHQMPLRSISRAAEAVERIDASLIERYKEATSRVLEGFDSRVREDLAVCYTPLHGVGAGVFLDLARGAGFLRISVVSSQEQPDPAFPTVDFPNPEEPGALDEAYLTADQTGSALILAHDPDADRVAIALPSRSGDGYTMLRGNELGAILAASIASRQEARGEAGTIGFSMVSSPIAAEIAHAHGLAAMETPTGFKWISRLPGLVYGFEEALGYLVNPETVRDKDGISAGLMVLAIAAERQEAGQSLWDALDDVRARYGGFASTQVSLRLSSPEAVNELMVAVRKNPTALFGEDGAQSFIDYTTPPAGSPAANLLRCDLPGGDRIIVRPSGTEPKLKVYLDSLRPDQSDAEAALAQLERSIRARVSQLI